jgi:hypothetical protein
VDLDPATLNMDLEIAAAQVKNGQVGGILYAHTYGDESTPVDFFAAIRRSGGNILIIDDRCLCVPDCLSVDANPADVSLYSTGYAKMVDLGSGGFAFLGSGVSYHTQVLPYRQADLEKNEQAYKSKIVNRQPFTYVESDWLQFEPVPDWATYAQQVTAAVSSSIAHRKELNAIYQARLPVELCLPEQFQLWRYNLRVEHKSAVLKAIFNAGLFASSHYASLAGIFAPGVCPQAESLGAHVINLFNDLHYTVEMAERTCDIIGKAL